MLNAIFTATVRHRRPIVAVEVASAAAILIAGATTDRLGFAVPILAVGGILAMVLAIVAGLRYRPAALVARPDVPSFDAPMGPAGVYYFTGFLGIFLLNLSVLIGNIVDRETLWQLDLALAALFVAALTLWFRAAWGLTGVSLRPDGVLDRGITGSLFVPWSAFTGDRPVWPTTSMSRLTIKYQGEARVRGLVPTGRRAITAQSVDPWYLTRAIHHYVVNPDRRPAIGTEAEHRHLAQAIAEQRV
jgi:hypothetical protein